ncbi:hypothetical protein [Lactiplantibacillus carotarum]|uniref:hypothetical protein n=1 Tax=Lactiplantibacillus carotarum TaxID=2993456 RepID=UPI00298F1895|nr:hypothetical protein [Lactiplantibacillus carotarum]
MGLFDGLKKLANEVTDSETCDLGENIADTTLRDNIRGALEKVDGVSRLSTDKIEHKKIENLNNDIGLDYQQAVFF